MKFLKITWVVGAVLTSIGWDYQQRNDPYDFSRNSRPPSIVNVAMSAAGWPVIVVGYAVKSLFSE